MSDHYLSRRKLLKRGLFAVASTLVPKLAYAEQCDGGIELRARKVQRPIGASEENSRLWHYNGLCPGPEIRAKKGDKVKVNLINELDVPTSIHWHGIRIANLMDGVSGLTQQPVLPGESFQYEFLVPDAGTYWYHSHHNSYEQVARGLYGPLIIDDPDNGFDRNNDMTFILDDWWLNADGTLDESFDDYMIGKQGGRIGNFFSINGRPLGEVIPLVAGKAHRIRLINAANARVFTIGASDHEVKIVAFDGQSVGQHRSIPNGGISLSPGQRVDLAFVPKSNTTLSLFDADGSVVKEDDNQQPISFVHFKSNGDDRQVSIPLVHQNTLDVPDIHDAFEARITMEGGKVGGLLSAKFNGKQLDTEALVENGQVWTFNGIANLPSKPLFSVTSGQSVIIELDNQTGWQHAMHLHGHHFQVFDRDKAKLSSIWRDTYLVDRLSKTHIAFVADNPGRWLFHCHMLQHAIAGMNTWFEVV